MQTDVWRDNIDFIIVSFMRRTHTKSIPFMSEVTPYFTSSNTRAEEEVRTGSLDVKTFTRFQHSCLWNAICTSMYVQHNRSLKVAVQGPDYYGPPRTYSFIHS
jgi:hypothetical protein